MANELNDIYKSVGSLQANAESAQAQRELLFEKMDANRDLMRELHDMQTAAMTAAVVSIREAISAGKKDCDTQISAVSGRVTTLEKDKVKLIAGVSVLGLSGGGISAYFTKLFGGP